MTHLLDLLVGVVVEGIEGRVQIVEMQDMLRSRDLIGAEPAFMFVVLMVIAPEFWSVITSDWLSRLKR